MAAPTSTIYAHPSYVIDVSGTNVAAGNNDYSVEYNLVNLHQGFSIVTGTLTAMTVTVLVSNLDGTLKDVTNDLFGVATLVSDKAYICNTPLPVKTLTIRAARSNATNAVAFTIFCPRK